MARKFSIADSFSILILIVYFAELVFPPVTTIANSGLVCIICFFAWLFLSFIKDKGYYRYMRLKTLIAFSFYFSTAFLPYLFGKEVIAHRYMALPLVSLGYFIYQYHNNHAQMKILTGALKISALLASITAITTILALINNPYISRSIKSSGAASDALAAKGIGGYSFIYFISIVAIILFHLFIVEKNNSKKALYLVLVSISVVLILLSNYMTALMVLITEAIVYCFIKIKKQSKRNGLIFIFACLAIAIVIYVVLIHFNRIIAMLPQRIARIFLSGNSNAITAIVSEFYIDRFPRLQESLETFIKFPLLGMVGHGVLSYEGEYIIGFGQHSFVFDTFALYGFLLGIGAIFSCTLPFHRNEWKKNDFSELTWAVLVGSIIIYVLNNATESVGLAVNIVYPFARDLGRRMELQQKNGNFN